MNLPDHIATTILSLIQDLGRDVTFRRIPASAYDPATGQSVAGANQDETVRCYFAAYSEQQIDGTLIQRGDRRAIIAARYGSAAITKTPSVDDILIGEGAEVRILSVQTIQIGTTPALFVCQVRG